jgi:hypothetical protein
VKRSPSWISIFMLYRPSHTAMRLLLRRSLPRKREVMRVRWSWCCFLKKATVAALADANYQTARSGLLARVKNDSGQDARDAVERFRSGVARIVESDGSLKPLTPQGDCVPVGIGTSCVLKVRVPVDIPSGVYALVLLGPDRKLLDLQMNAAYRAADLGAAPSFVVAGDMQWGDAPAIASAGLSFVSLMNALNGAGKAPDFIVMAGDIVDGQFGSASSLWSKFFGGAENYTRSRTVIEPLAAANQSHPQHRRRLTG